MKLHGTTPVTVALTQGQAAVVVDVSWGLPGGGASLYVLCTGADGKVSELSRVVYPKAPELPGNGVVHRWETMASDASRGQVQVVFDLLPPDVARIEFVVATSRAGAVLTELSDVEIVCWEPRSGETVGTWTVPRPGLAKRLELGSVGRVDSQWQVQIQPEPSDQDLDALFMSRLT